MDNQIYNSIVSFIYEEMTEWATSQRWKSFDFEEVTSRARGKW